MTWFGNTGPDWDSERRRLIFMIVGLALLLVALVALFVYVGSSLDTGK
jgi:flagellar basal body-associated protein FliL